MEGLIKLTGLWQKESDKGNFYTGRLGGGKLLLFKNKFKEKDTDPDLILYITKAEKREKPEAAADTGKDQDDPF